MSNTEEYKNHQEEPEIDELTKDRYLGGHEYDGIRELDNKLPRWWLYMFYATIIFAAVYLVGYHVTNWWPSQEGEYQNEMSMVKATAQPEVDLATLVPLTTPEDLKAGQEIFKRLCFTCHGTEGQGNAIGPNFTDQYWIHGDTLTKTVSIKDLYKVVTTGVPNTAMISFTSTKQLNSLQIQQVLSFILTLQGTTPPNPKAPQGVKYDKIG